MTPREMKQRLARERFTPFQIVMNNGQRYEVLHPEFAILTNTSAIHLYPPAPEDEELADTAFVVISLRNIASIEPLEPATK